MMHYDTSASPVPRIFTDIQGIAHTAPPYAVIPFVEDGHLIRIRINGLPQETPHPFLPRGRYVIEVEAEGPGGVTKEAYFVEI